MNKKEISYAVRELKNNPSKYTLDLNIDHPLHGLACRDFEKGKIVSMESVITFLKWQTMMFNGSIDEEELSNCLFLLKNKRVMIV